MHTLFVNLWYLCLSPNLYGYIWGLWFILRFSQLIMMIFLLVSLIVNLMITFIILICLIVMSFFLTWCCNWLSLFSTNKLTNVNHTHVANVSIYHNVFYYMLYSAHIIRDLLCHAFGGDRKDYHIVAYLHMKNNSLYIMHMLMMIYF